MTRYEDYDHRLVRLPVQHHVSSTSTGTGTAYRYQYQTWVFGLAVEYIWYSSAS
jgi:hypothetical protein